MIRLNAGNDRSGNPRRVYVLVRNSVIVGVWDEGYAGTHAVPERYRDAAAGCVTIETTPRQYRTLVRRQGEVR